MLKKYIFHLQGSVPSIYVYLSSVQFRARYGVEPLPAVIVWDLGYILNGPPVQHRANTEKQGTIHTHIHTYGQLICLSTVGGSCVWRKPTHEQRELANSTQKDPGLPLHQVVWLQMAALLWTWSGFAGSFFLLKRSFSSPLSPRSYLLVGVFSLILQGLYLAV